MTRAGWTYEIPPSGSDAVGLEDYGVEDSSGEFVGKVLTILRREEAVFLAVERGTPLVSRDRRALSWDAVGEIDHAALLVRLNVPEAEVEDAPALEPEKAVEGGSAEAVRLTDVPSTSRAVPAPAAAGPVDRPTYAAALVLGLLGVFATLVVVALLTATESAWPFALLPVPIVLLTAAGFLAYRFFFKRQAARS